MLCFWCNKNPATFLVKITIDDFEYPSLPFCAKCVAERQEARSHDYMLNNPGDFRILPIKEEEEI
jgi:protein-arginine kinase activator protein McsA